MKNLSSLILLLCLIVSFSCKKDSYTYATVMVACDNGYIKVLDKVYAVCNSEKTANLEQNDKVLVNFHLVKKNCGFTPSSDIPCPNTSYPNGWINIIDIKKL